MTAVTILYYSLAICAFLFVGILWYLVYHVVQTLQKTEKVVNDVADITQDLDTTKNIVKKNAVQILGIVQNFLRPESTNHNGQRTSTTRYRTRD